ncbi:hypothetical protein VNO78_07917 [Psophocarpus tetragonolobus]|uniref:Uncharacterized protein n=1 Tax=Psophocarpus tetragonolobus TaxID=3891 RepID=A0AAN9STW3_PSOTE
MKIDSGQANVNRHPGWKPPDVIALPDITTRAKERGNDLGQSSFKAKLLGTATSHCQLRNLVHAGQMKLEYENGNRMQKTFRLCTTPSSMPILKETRENGRTMVNVIEPSCSDGTYMAQEEDMDQEENPHSEISMQP